MLTVSDLQNLERDENGRLILDSMVEHVDYLVKEEDKGKRKKRWFSFSDNDVLVHPNVLSLYDDIQGITVLSDGLTNVDELKDRVNSIFDGEKNDAIQLSTIHKAKGLESDNVFILCPSLMPSKLAKKEWEIETERNLIYVAYTRAKKTLNFISEADYGREYTMYSSTENMKKTLDNIKKKIIFNTELGISEKNYNTEVVKTATITLGDRPKEKKEQPINNKKVKGGIKMRGLLE